MTWAHYVLYGLGGYLAVGLLVGLVYVAVAIGRVDPSGKGSSVAFRLLILPGCAAMWPFLLRNWVRGLPEDG